MVVVRDVTDSSMAFDDHGGRREPLRAALSWAVGTAWWATGPIRFGGRVALRAADAAVTEITRRGRPLLTNPPAAGPATEGPVEPLIRAVLRPLVVRVVDVALTELDVTQLVLQYVDLDAVAAKLDVQAVVERVDVDAVVNRVDLDAIAAKLDVEAVIDRVDLDAIAARLNVEAVIDRVDLDRVVSRVDLDAAVARVALDRIIDRIDIDGIVAGVDLQAVIDRIDIDGIVAGVDLQAVIDRIDIASIVALVDPDPVVSRVDFDAALAKIDMIGIAQQVVDGINLPGIIRDSTGSLASEAVHGVRVQGQLADDAVGQLVGRVFRRRASTIDGFPSE